MSDRERWIVYPLLFMTLGIALRDKVVPPSFLGDNSMRLVAGETSSRGIRCGEMRANHIVCDRLDVTNGERPVVVLGTDSSTRGGIVETFSNQGAPQVRLLPTDAGGIVYTSAGLGKPSLIMGDIGQAVGVFVQSPENGSIIPLTAVAPQPEKKPDAPSAPQKTEPTTPPGDQAGEKTDEAAEKSRK
jgi:hypothetical protein